MSAKKLNQLFQAARKVEPPSVPATFAEEVVRAIKQQPVTNFTPRLTLFEELNARFVTLATVTVVILVLGVAANLALGSPEEETDSNDTVTQLSTQWLLLPEGL